MAILTAGLATSFSICPNVAAESGFGVVSAESQPNPPASSVLAWGENWLGDLGNGTLAGARPGSCPGGRVCNPRPAPVKLPRDATFQAVAAGDGFAIALTTAGQVMAWGRNEWGQLGNGVTTGPEGVCSSFVVCNPTPALVDMPTGVTVTAISAGSAFSLALTSSGQVMGWGYDPSGELGFGPPPPSSCGCTPNPTPISFPVGTRITAVAAGGGFALALTDGGQVFAWGDNSYGELGTGVIGGTPTSCIPWCRATPSVAHLPDGAVGTAIAAGHGYALALTRMGDILWWGSFGIPGEVASPTPGTYPLPTAAGVVATVIGAGQFAAAALSNGDLISFGNVTIGGTNLRVPPPGTVVTSLKVGDGFVLALTSTGRVLAWGYNADGELGTGTTRGTTCGGGICSDLGITHVRLPRGTRATAVAAGAGAAYALSEPSCSAPTAVHAAPVSGDRAVISWVPSDRTCTEFSVLAYSSTGGSVVHTTAWRQSLTIGDLAPDASYVFAVAAYNGKSWTSWSDWSSWIAIDR